MFSYTYFFFSIFFFFTFSSQKGPTICRVSISWQSHSCRAKDMQTVQTLWAAHTGQKMTEPLVLHSANMKELILSPCWLGHTQILGAEFECDLPAPRLPHVAQVRLTASLKAAYGNQLTQAQSDNVFQSGWGMEGVRWLMVDGWGWKCGSDFSWFPKRKKKSFLLFKTGYDTCQNQINFASFQNAILKSIFHKSSL